MCYISKGQALGGIARLQSDERGESGIGSKSYLIFTFINQVVKTRNQQNMLNM